MTLTGDLKKLGSVALFPSLGRVERRWGQVLRETPQLHAFLEQGKAAGVLLPLSDVARVHGGVVTRANAYFLVRELPLDEVPFHLRVTQKDLERIAVVEDGLGTAHKIERPYLRPVIKGPEMLAGPSRVEVSDLLLFDAGKSSKDDLRNANANGVVKYLHRGETVNYTVSQDRLKQGVPAKRSNIRNRKPYWYSLQTPSTAFSRVVVPEHFDNRFPAPLAAAGDPAVVIDKLFSVAPKRAEHAGRILASLNSLLTWYQIELRGRTQLGQGVLEMKVADWEGLLVASPDLDWSEAEEDFTPLSERDTLSVEMELASEDRLIFDDSYLRLCGVSPSDDMQTAIEREFRALMSERGERARSVLDAKAARAATRAPAASVDAYAGRIAGSMDAFPDPRDFLEPETVTQLVLVGGPADGSLAVGEDLFTQGEVYAGGHLIAAAGDLQSARFVRGALLHDRSMTSVAVPTAQHLVKVMSEWEGAVAEWLGRFNVAAEMALAGLSDDRLRNLIRARALGLLKAE